jgi:high-affinity nickel permease
MSGGSREVGQRASRTVLERGRRAETFNGASLATIMVFPALFAAGMTLIDTTDGVLMLGGFRDFRNGVKGRIA